MKEKIVLGLGNNVDYEILWNESIISQLAQNYSIKESELNTDIEITSFRDLVVSILGFVQNGRGGERFVLNNDIIEEFSSLFEKKITMGGTSIRAAAVLEKLGIPSTLHLVNNNKHVREQIPPSCGYISSAEQDSVYPHLIIQFKKGDIISTDNLRITAPHSNRIIYDNDPDNMEMKLSPQLADAINKATFVLISGVNAIHSEQTMLERLQQLEKIFNSTEQKATLFYEDACFHNKKLIEHVHKHLMDQISIYSMNEDELMSYLNRDVDLLSIAEVTRALADIALIITAPIIVIHTKYWALAYGKNAGDYSSALLGGITVAGTRLRLGDNFTKNDIYDTLKLKKRRSNEEFAGQLNQKLVNQVCCIASWEIVSPNPTTIGLGDSFVGGFLAATLAPLPKCQAL